MPIAFKTEAATPSTSVCVERFHRVPCYTTRRPPPNTIHARGLSVRLVSLIYPRFDLDVRNIGIPASAYQLFVWRQEVGLLGLGLRAQMFYLAHACKRSYVHIHYQAVIRLYIDC